MQVDVNIFNLGLIAFFFMIMHAFTYNLKKKELKKKKVYWFQEYDIYLVISFSIWSAPPGNTSGCVKYLAIVSLYCFLFFRQAW
jgi:hypothetical protein